MSSTLWTAFCQVILSSEKCYEIVTLIRKFSYSLLADYKGGVMLESSIALHGIAECDGSLDPSGGT